MNLSSVLESLGEGRPDEPAVILRLRLMAADKATGPEAGVTPSRQ